METVNIRDIQDNPFQSRASIDMDKIRELADEIRLQGFWESPLRARKVDGRYELVFGHRRLGALKLLGHKTINLELVELDDAGMATQALVENLQRYGLSDVEKANAIKRLLDLGTAGLTTKKLGVLLGVSERTVNEYVHLAQIDRETQESAKKAGMSRTAIRAAEEIGGIEFVKLAAIGKLNRDALDEIQAEAGKLRPTERQKFREKITKKRLTKASEIKKVARRLHVEQIKRQVKSKKIPPDLHDVLIKWTLFIKQWRRELREVAPYREYINEDPDSAFLFRKEVGGLITDLQALL